MSTYIGTGTLVDLHGYFHLWFPFDQPENVLAALMRETGPRVVCREQGQIEVLNVQAARRWTLKELTEWPELTRGKLVVMHLDPENSPDGEIHQFEEDAELLHCVELAALSWLGREQTHNE